MDAVLPYNPTPAREGYVAVQNARLYYREIGRGRPIIILHGGPDFDHNYLLPGMDRLSDAFRLIYYDQRGRGQSGHNVQPADVTLDSEIEDLETLRDYFQLEETAVLGHSWGGALAMEYAIRHPDRLSHLILLNIAPASHEDYMFFRQELSRKREAGDADKMEALSSTARYAQGDLEADAEYYRIHFKTTVRRPEQLEQVIRSLRTSMTAEGVVKARKIEDRLYAQTWISNDYNLLPRLGQLSLPTLIIHGENDFIPVECAAHIVQSMPAARLVLLRECGHFSYLECPDEVGREIGGFFDGRQQNRASTRTL
jgi:proline iminopeptidase